MTTRTDTLRIKLETDGQGNVKASLASVEQGLTGVARGAQTTGKSLVNFGTVAKGSLIVMAAMAAIELKKLAVESVHTAAELDKLSEVTGASVEQLSRMITAAELNDSSAGAMAGAFRELNKSMQDAATNGGGQAALAFRTLGIDVTDANGKMRATDQVMLELSDRFASMADGPEKNAFAMALLRRNTDELIPVLNKLRVEVGEVGHVVSAEFAQAADEFERNMVRMKQSTMSFAQAIAASVLPSINKEFLAIRALTSDSAKLEHLQGQLDALLDPRKSATIDPNARAAMIEQLRKQIDALKATAGVPDTAAPGRSSGETPSLADAELMRQGRAERLRIAQEFALEEQAVREEELEWERQGFLERARMAREMRESERTELDKLAEDWQDTADQMDKASVGWANNAADAITNMVMTGKGSFKDLANSIIADIIRMQTRAMLASIYTSLFGGGAAANSSANSGVAGQRAGGGDVYAGKTYLVGERGPELFTPGSSGAITPNSKMGGDTYHIDNRGADAAAVMRLERTLRRMNATIEHRAVSAVIEAQRRGKLAGAFR